MTLFVLCTILSLSRSFCLCFAHWKQNKNKKKNGRFRSFFNKICQLMVAAAASIAHSKVLVCMCQWVLNSTLKNVRPLQDMLITWSVRLTIVNLFGLVWLGRLDHDDDDDDDSRWYSRDWPLATFYYSLSITLLSMRVKCDYHLFYIYISYIRVATSMVHHFMFATKWDSVHDCCRLATTLQWCWSIIYSWIELHFTVPSFAAGLCRDLSLYMFVCMMLMMYYCIHSLCAFVPPFLPLSLSLTHTHIFWMHSWRQSYPGQSRGAISTQVGLVSLCFQWWMCSFVFDCVCVHVSFLYFFLSFFSSPI